MSIGERLRQIRIDRGYSAERLAEEVGISRATIYRYENESIKKIPIAIMEKLCKVLQIQPYELLQNSPDKDSLVSEKPVANAAFEDPKEAMAFLLRLPSVAAYGGYDIDKMDNETILEFANEVLHQIETVSYKFKG